MDHVDDSLNKISLQEKVKMLSNIKKVRQAEIKEKGEKLSKEIDELEETRKKEMKALDDQLKNESNELDEEMFKAMDALFFRDRRTYLMNRARLERTQEIVDDTSEITSLKGESFLYDISEKIFAGENLKLQEIISLQGKPLLENDNGYIMMKEDVFQSEYRRDKSENNYEQNSQAPPNVGNYSSNSKTVLERFEEEWNHRTNY